MTTDSIALLFGCRWLRRIASLVMLVMLVMLLPLAGCSPVSACFFS